jgi:hypothetical protein
MAEPPRNLPPKPDVARAMLGRSSVYAPELPTAQNPTPEEKARARRPRPKAVPALAREGAAAPTDNVRPIRPPKRPEPAPAPAPEAEPEAEAPARAPAPGKKPKRELPPYLRIVK